MHIKLSQPFSAWQVLTIQDVGCVMEKVMYPQIKFT